MMFKPFLDFHEAMVWSTFACYLFRWTLTGSFQTSFKSEVSDKIYLLETSLFCRGLKPIFHCHFPVSDHPYFSTK